VGFETVQEYVRWLVSRKSKQLVGKAGLTKSDREDIEQELTLHLLERWDRYDPSRGSERTFVARVIDNEVARLLRDRRRLKRGCMRVTCSLNEMIPDEEDGWVERAATIPAGLNHEELRDVALDLADALEELPGALRALCDRLRTQTVSEVSRATGIPRWRLYASIEELRRLLAEAGTQDYL
jgi:RNA polymerase sigma-70 factor (ECF subfamily)